MKLRLFLAGLGLGAALNAAPPPNIVFILCDDLGFGDTGPSFQNERAARKDRSLPAFATPQIDRLAAEGVQLLKQVEVAGHRRRVALADGMEQAGAKRAAGARRSAAPAGKKRTWVTTSSPARV